MSIVSFNNKNYRWNQLFICATGPGYVPTVKFWGLWKQAKQDLQAMGFFAIKHAGEWLIESRKIQP